MQQLSPLDASFVYAETARTPMHIGSVAIYDPSTAPGGFVRFKDILAFIGSRLPGARAFGSGWSACPSTWTIPTGSRIPSSTWSSTSGTSPCPSQATLANWPSWRPAFTPARST